MPYVWKPKIKMNFQKWKKQNHFLWLIFVLFVLVLYSKSVDAEVNLEHKLLFAKKVISFVFFFGHSANCEQSMEKR